MSAQPTPRQLGYRMPAEWEPHRATWLSWPHRRKTWPNRFEPIPAFWAELTAVLAESELVEIMAGGPEVYAEAKSLVGHIPNVVVHDIPTNDAWMRDHGPTFLVGPPGAAPALIDWRFNAWGSKYPAYDLDDAIPRQIAAMQNRRRFDPGIVLEGGSIDVNGAGCVLTSEQCLLNQNRNPHLSRGEIEQYLYEYLNLSKVLWLGEGIAGDDTDGHVDDMTRFASPTTIVTVVESRPNRVNYRALQENLERLSTFTDANGRPFEIVTLPMPEPLLPLGHQLPASYANFYIANEVVVAPIFHDPADEAALATLTRLFPTRRVVGLYATDLVFGLGAIHCITQQEPRVG